MGKSRGLTCFVILLLASVCFGECPTADLNRDCYVDLQDFAIMAAQWLTGNKIVEPDDIVWIAIDDPGVYSHENFNGEMSRYETTVRQYCNFLNAAIRSGDIFVSKDKVFSARQPNLGYNYYIELYPALSSSSISYSSTFAHFSVLSRDGMSMSGHPVNVSWFGAKAFCDYYGYRLPTGWEWQAVADYDGTYTYGCGVEINETLANYDSSNPMGFTAMPYTSPVGYFGAYGYGLCDIAGNLAEWTSTFQDINNPTSQMRTNGGHWASSDTYCSAAISSYSPTTNYSGFRACRGNERAVPDAIGHEGLSAISAIESRYFKCRVSHEYNSGHAGYVNYQFPAEGTMQAPGEIVDITITLGPDPQIEWVTVNDPGFSGEFGKYEITNAQYCIFLNAALGSGDITITDGKVYGANGSNTGEDYVGMEYYRTLEASSFSDIGKSGIGFYVRTRNGYDMSNHPISAVSFYGAKAFCKYYGYRIPSLSEWQAVADYDGSYTYGCGTTINIYKANYGEDNPYNFTEMPYTTHVGRYAAVGYGVCDMAGNVHEWVGSTKACGGSWTSTYYNCEISEVWDSFLNASTMSSDLGFRVCR